MLVNNMTQERFKFSIYMYNIAISRQSRCSTPEEMVFTGSDQVDQRCTATFLANAG